MARSWPRGILAPSGVSGREWPSTRRTLPRPRPLCSRKRNRRRRYMTTSQATAEVFFTAFKALPRQEQEAILTRITQDRELHRILENISDRLAIAAERPKPSRPLRDY